MKIYDWQSKCNISGTHVRALREARHLTQEQLAARPQVLGVQLNQKAISRIEAGERVVADYELKALATVFGTDPNSFLDEV